MAGELIKKTVKVTPGTQYPIEVGKGGPGISVPRSAANSRYASFQSIGENSSAFGLSARGSSKTKSYRKNDYTFTDFVGGGANGNDAYYSGDVGGPGKSGWVKIVRKIPNPNYVPARLCKIDGKDYICMASPVSYTQVVYDTAGSYTFTVPEGVTFLYVTVCGGGAGGVTTAFYKRTCPTYTLEGFPGGDTYVGSVIAYGGKAGKSVMDGWSYKPEQGANVTGGIVGETHSVQTQDFDLVGYGFRLSIVRQAVKWNTANLGYWRCYETEPNHKTWIEGSGTIQSYGIYGCGGSSHHFYDSDGWTLQVGVAGNSGGFLSQVELRVSPGQKIPVVVGAGGEGSIYESDTDRWRFNAANGTSGFAIIEYGVRNDLLVLVGGNE